MSQRSAKLIKFFNLVVQGKRPITNVESIKLFLESIQDQVNRSSCIERIIASPDARRALHTGLRFNITPQFINQFTTPFLHYLADPAIKQLCNGQFLQDILTLIVEPKTVWTAFVTCFKRKELSESGIHALAWMVVELLSFPPSSSIDIRDDAQEITDDGSLLLSSSAQIRSLGYKIQHILMIKSTNAPSNPDFAPGGRHDNDFSDFRKVAIYPTAHEFRSTDKPFYCRTGEISELSRDQRLPAHLDNQFRLMREDMLSELRDDIQVALGKKKGKRGASLLEKLSIVNILCGDDRRLRPCSLAISCAKGLNALSSRSAAERKKFLDDNPNYLKHNAFGCLLRDKEIIAFTTLDRNVNQLCLDVPVIVLKVLGEQAMKKALASFKLYNDIQFLVVDAAVFAYEPILKCLQDKTDLPLSRELLGYQGDGLTEKSGLVPDDIIENIQNEGNGNLQYVIGTKTPVNLDRTQLQSFVSGLTQTVSLIQGPPGTGKSFIGALLAKIFHDHSKEVILVMCYTNHALDQFLEDLLDIGIDSSSIVRLGSKSTIRTQSLSLAAQRSSYKHSRSTWGVIDKYKSEATDIKERLTPAFKQYVEFKVDARTMLEFLEFEEPSFYSTFMPPENEGMTIVGENGRNVDSSYLYDLWARGREQPSFCTLDSSEDSHRVWSMDTPTRQEYIRTWSHQILEEQVSNLHESTRHIDQCQKHIEKVWNQRTNSILKSKRIIGCTTTAAAMYTEEIRAVSPGILLLEEAGEILESHVLAALNSETKQLVLIGDHQQLRPKINNYALSVEKGDGYDLNRSLFERLVLAGYPHSTLAKQHRMCPEISCLVRGLTYPDLEDAPGTLSRPAPRGLQDRVIFFHHENLETNFAQVSDRRDEGTKGSKTNSFEVEVVLKIVKYLGQQGYGTDKVVVLTPYLGQLHLLRDRLRKDNDPVLNDLDSYDLVKAGLLSQASANYSKRPIRLSTIDNYQGEECEIVVSTLTRSNTKGDIGFMAAPQRLNVLLSRARNILIMVGNVNTFVNSRKGRDVWVPFVNSLKEKGHLYDGLPVKCEQHPTRTAIVKTIEQFDTECPDGGCPLPCGVKLACGLHTCPYKCHQLSDHSKMKCQKITEWTCSRGHKITCPCFQVNGACQPCIAEDRAEEAKKRRDMKLELERERKQKEYMRELTKLQDEISHQRRLCKERQEDEDRQRVLAQHRNDLSALKSSGSLAKGNTAIDMSSGGGSNMSRANSDSNGNVNASSSSTHMPSSTKTPTNRAVKNSPAKPVPPVTMRANSSAQDDWDYQKQFQGARSDSIDKLMAMIGLEQVKDKFLTIKARVDTALRQGVDLSKERFGSVLIGNPGTGKTTVARLYANFLGSVGVLPGSNFVETTGSMLANEGIPGCQKKINTILNSGGGVLFIDEAYQLTEGQTQGTQVMNFLLAEVENLTGKMAVVLAGYRTHMEKFFAHNPGLPSRFPHEFKFEDYTDNELLRIFEYNVGQTYQNRMKLEGGAGGLYSRIVSRRVGRGRGNEGFGNARAIQNVCSRIYDRQATRLKRERKRNASVDDMLLTKEDLIGPEPSQALQNCTAWQKLQTMIGLDTVKKDIKAFLDSMQYNYHRELEEKPLLEFTLNRVFLGSPGTGKTSVAKLYGQILVDIGFLSNGEVIVKNPADFVGSVLGESEKNTKGILASTVGKVLVIDEAYGLFGGGTKDKTGSQTNQFKTAVIDTIVAEVQSTPGDDRCVLLLGYKDQMEEMFQNVNPGLTRRFPLDSAFTFHDFTDDEMSQIFDLKLNQQGFDTTSLGKKVAMDVLGRARNRANFGNAGEIDILLNKAKITHQKRISTGQPRISSTFLPEDFDEDYDRGQHAAQNVKKLFEGTVGCDKIVAQMEEYCRIANGMRALDLDPRTQIPFNFLFRGPPGTGKTTTARKIGQLYYSMNLLSSTEVIEASATDLVGQYIGHTGPKTQELLEKALGKVLLIDEAYRLAEGQFAKEAIDEIVACITHPKYAQKLVIILAGYEEDINRLMAINPGLTSRFPESIVFNGLDPDASITLLTALFRKQRDELREKGKEFNIGILEHLPPDLRGNMHSYFAELRQTPNWANARDVQDLAKKVFAKTIQNIGGGRLVLTDRDILVQMGRMVQERLSRSTVGHRHSGSAVNHLPTATDTQSNVQPGTNVNASTNTTTTTNTNTPPQSPNPDPIKPATPTLNTADPRDAGVSDDIWNQLQLDKLKAQKSDQEYHHILQEVQTLENTLKQQNEYANDKSANDAATKMAHEKERLRRELERRALEEDLEKLRKKRAQEEEKRRKEAQAQKKLRQMGVCVMGYRWIKQSGGYRCAGGSHWVSDAQLGV
ncbi:P-loop containing nucleoside triphosphate hydrolase protein [Aspergillus pseudocaelatus]|uniref:P-loop containing nucleoside triphosphate hydrolase protein n=1 Tax=Aspergillus pseudocaelatus TaxID=1825620 RepID=A0ABQ6WCG2_9EURO|nr:P-loop containing nucleoside triphosphate hydrolase protein [Aspergillus pseudocaelatus]